MDIDVLIETYKVLKEYIGVKDRQAAADHLIGSISDFDLSDTDMKALAGIDAYLKRAIEEYLGDDIDDDDYQEDWYDTDDDY